MPSAARLYAVGDLRVEDVPAPAPPTDGWTTVAVTSVGLCGSDLHWFTEGGIGETSLDRPVVPGHEMAGVALDGELAGRRVAIDPAIPCERCESCRAGYRNLCPTVRFAGHGDLDGGLQEQLAWPTHLLHPLPDEIDDDAGALLEPLGVAIHAVGLAHVGLGDDVLVVGAGPIGALAVAVALRAGAARVFAADPLVHRRGTALRYGATDAWAPEDATPALLEATGGRGADRVIEIAGEDSAIELAVAGARPGARVALGGIPSTRLSAFPAAAARRKGLTFAMVRRMNETYPRAIELVRSGLDLGPLVTARFPLAQAPEAFASAAARTGDKTVVVVSESTR